MRDMLFERAHPFLFHWSWTEGKHEKLRYSKETGTWYLLPACNEKFIRGHLTNSSVLNACCDLGRLEEHSFLLLPETLPAWAHGTGK